MFPTIRSVQELSLTSFEPTLNIPKKAKACAYSTSEKPRAQRNSSRRKALKRALHDIESIAA